MTTILNLFGGPGTGKSTSAAYVYSKLKAHGKDVELVREYVKSWAHEKRPIQKYDQIYFTGKQSREEALLFGRVDYIVTDSPVFLGAYYSSKYSPGDIAKGVREVVLAFYRQSLVDGHQHINVFLDRTKAYNPNGRYETEDQARQIDVEMRHMLNKEGFNYFSYGTDVSQLDRLQEDLVNGVLLAK